MTSISLIPAYRRDARKRHRRLRRWGATCAGYVAFLVATYAFCTAVWGANGRTLDSQFQHTAGEIAQADQKIIALEKELRHNERLLAANRVLADQPDWSLLLALLSHALQDDVVLRTCQLDPVWIDPETALPRVLPIGSQGNARLLSLRGLGKSQAAVVQFVLRLEQTELFEEVKIMDTSRETFMTTEAVSFWLNCLLPAGNGEVR